MIRKKLISGRVFRFAIIGFCNSAISFGILNISFYELRLAIITSSLIATSCALIFSFIMNRDFVFGDKSKKAYLQLPAFVIITIIGSLLILNLVYILSLRLLLGHEHLIIDIIKHTTSITLSSNFVDINLSTTIGAISAMFWNYNGYKRFVFKGSSKYETSET